MFGDGLTRRFVLGGLGACTIATVLCGCAPTNAPAVQATAQPVSGVRIRDIQVNTTPLLAQSGNPTAQWAQQALTGALAQTFAPYMAPTDPNAATLSVRIDSIVLGSIGPEGGAIDTMKGVVTLGGAKTRLRATAFYNPSPVDQTLWEQALQGRVSTVSQSFAQFLLKKMAL
jgi:hypothetical protein